MSRDMAMRFTRDQLLEQLRGQLGKAVLYDKEQKALHKKAEKEALERFRASLREALKWDYATARKNWFSVKETNRPSCPDSMETTVRRAIAMVERSAQKTYTVSDNSWLIWTALTFDMPKRKDVC